MNSVQPGSFLTLHYRLARADDGVELVNTFGVQPATLSLGAGELAPAMEALLIGLPEGAHARFELAAGAAFGERNPALLQRVKRALLDRVGKPGAAYAPGDTVQLPTPDGSGTYAGVVREDGAESLLLDFNHPLAGAALEFEVRVIGVL